MKMLNLAKLKLGCLSREALACVESVKRGLSEKLEIMETENALAAVAGEYFDPIKADLKIIAERRREPYTEFLEDAIELIHGGANPSEVLEVCDFLKEYPPEFTIRARWFHE